MDPQNNKWSEIVDFINKIWPFNDNIELTKSTTLGKDLGVGGDDADELIYQFSKTFNVNVDNFTLSKYFEGYPEGNFLTNLFSKKTPIIKEKELTLGDLEEAVKIGKLDDMFLK
jgi:hypothetical protein